MNDHSKAIEDTWAILELMGHNIIAGHISEVAMGGSSMIRVDVPKTGSRDAFTKFFNPSAIYSIAPCNEEAALEVVKYREPKPVSIYVPRLEVIEPSNGTFEETPY